MEAQNQLTTKQGNGAVAVAGAWNKEQTIVPSSITAPRIHLMQASSERVKEGKSNLGDVLKLPSGTVIAKKDQSFTIIPLGLREGWKIEEKVGKVWKWRGSEPRTAMNDDLPWEFSQGGTEWRRTKMQEYFVLLPADIAKEAKALEAVKKGGFADPDDALLPCMLTFAGGAIKAGGAEISTFFAKAQHFNTPLFYSQFKLGVTSTTNADGQSWLRYTVEKADKTPQEYWPTCAKWQEMISKGAVKVEVEEAEEQAAQPAKQANTKGRNF